LIEHGKAEVAMRAVLAALQKEGLVPKRSKQRLDSTHVLGAVARLSALECVRETLALALEELKPKLALEQWPEFWELLWERYVESKLDYKSSEDILQAKRRQAGRPAQPSAARTGLDKAYRIETFDISITERKAICPEGKRSTQCSELTEQKSGKVTYRFEFGRQCPAFKLQMQQRNGIEGSISELVRGHGLRRARYKGFAQVPSGVTRTASSVKSTARAAASLWLYASSYFVPNAPNSSSALTSPARLPSKAIAGKAKPIANPTRTRKRIFIISSRVLD
jgi:hypothetical protein